MSRMSPPCGSMPPVKITSAQSRSSSANSSVFRLRSSNRPRLWQQSRDGYQTQRRRRVFGTEDLGRPLEAPKCVRLETRIDEKHLAALCARYLAHLCPSAVRAERRWKLPAGLACGTSRWEPVECPSKQDHVHVSQGSLATIKVDVAHFAFVPLAAIDAATGTDILPRPFCRSI